MTPQIWTNELIGGSSESEADHQVPAFILENGWEATATVKAYPAIQIGVGGICWHNPMGQHLGELMQLDQALWQDEHFIGDFVQMIRRLRWKHPEVRQIAYVGSGDRDQNFIDAKPSEWMDRFHRSLKPYLDAEMDIVFDAAASAGAMFGVAGTTDDIMGMVHVKALMESYGGRVGVESFPGMSLQWTQGMMALGYENHHTNMHRLPQHIDHEGRWVVRFDASGERTVDANIQCSPYVRICWDEADPEVSAKRVIDDGDVAMVRWTWRNGETFDRLFLQRLVEHAQGD